MDATFLRLQKALLISFSFRINYTQVHKRRLAKQDVLVDRFAEKVKQRGASVFLAQDGPAALNAGSIEWDQRCQTKMYSQPNIST